MIDWSQIETAENKAAKAHQELLAKLAQKRWELETAGIVVGGVTYQTDDRSKLLILGAAVEAMIDSTIGAQWKVGTAGESLSSSDVIKVARAIRDYTQACFTRELEILKCIEDGTFSESMIEEEWPNNVYP